MKKSLLITETVPEFFLKDLSSLGFEVVYKPDILLPELKIILPSFHGILLRSKFTFDSELIHIAKNLELILRPGSGLEIIDQNVAKNCGIRIINSPEGNRDAVGEHAIGLLLSLANHIHTAFNEVSGGSWNRKKNTGIELKGKTIGIIGFGNTGSAFSEKLTGFGLKMIAYDKYKEGYASPPVIECGMDEIFNDADIVSYHIPMSAENKYLIDLDYLLRFKKPVILINTSRGGILKTIDLLRAIQKGIVTGAALDVLENENFSDYKKEEKELLEGLLKTGRVLITPHIAGLTKESEIKIFSLLIDKLADN